MLVIGLGLGG